MNDQEKKHDYHPITALDSFIKGLENEGDRATVILVAAKLDTILFQLLQKHFISVPGSKDELLETDGPLGNFGPKINMAYRLGLINASFSHSLHLIRKIRNSFAHEVEGCTLNSGAHRDRVRELISPVENSKFFKEVCNTFKKDDKFELASIQFRTMAAVICTGLDILFLKCIALSDKNALNLLDVMEEKISKIIPEAKK